MKPSLRHFSAFLLLLTLLAAGSSQAASQAAECAPPLQPAGSRAIGDWIGSGNWRAPGNLSLGLRAPQTFFASRTLPPHPQPLALPPAAEPLAIDRLTMLDPADGARRSVEFVLATRLYAEALLVLYNGKVFASRSWHDAASDAPRFLPGVGRAFLSLLGAQALADGRLHGERAVARYLPPLAGDAGLRRLSVQRLLDGKARFAHGSEAIAAWRRAAGWAGGTVLPAADGTSAAAGVRAWLQNPAIWDAALENLPAPASEGGPEDDLLAWLLAATAARPLADVFCRQLTPLLRPAQPLTWLADAAGDALGDGLVMALDDLARAGQMLLDARALPARRGQLPEVFLAALLAPANGKSAQIDTLGFKAGAERRQGFVRLSSGSRLAIVGAYGNSLYVDFDRRLVVALAAAHPEAGSPLARASLEGVWERFSAALPPPGRR